MGEFVKLSLEEAANEGIRYSTKRDSDTHETRARLTVPGADVTLTFIPEGGGGWQKSHRHVRVVELSTVISGQLVAVEKAHEGTLAFKSYGSGDAFKTTPGLSHNTFVLGGTMMSTIKLYDDPDKRDWIADPELDQETLGLSYEEALERCL